MNLVTDGVSALALGVEPAEADVMSRPPRDTRAPILDRAGILWILALGSYVGAGALLLHYVYLRSGAELDRRLAQTVAFTGIILIQKMNVLNFRSLHQPLRAGMFWTNPWVLAAISSSLLLQVAAVYVPLLQRALHTYPLRGVDWLVILAVAVPVYGLAHASLPIADFDLFFGNHPDEFNVGPIGKQRVAFEFPATSSHGMAE